MIKHSRSTLRQGLLMWLRRSAFLMGVMMVLVASSSHAGLFNHHDDASDPDVQSDFFSVNGVRIHYLVQGSGDPVILIHAWLASAQSNWVRPGTMAQLANNHHMVVALDLAGYGESDKPDDPAAYGDGWVEQVYQLMNHLKIPKARIVGYSMGGLIALKFMVLHPDRTTSGLLGGMGYMGIGSQTQQNWEGMSKPENNGAAQLALTPAQLMSVHVPVEMVVGSRDPVKEKYIGPLLEIRKDWPVVEVPGKGHISTVGSQEFKDDVVSWTARQ